jgi:hypothetical protein
MNLLSSFDKQAKSWIQALFSNTPFSFLILCGAAVAFAHVGWKIIINNFALESLNLSGSQVGLMQSLREIPGFLAFTLIFILLVIREQKMAVLSLVILGLGVSFMGFVQTPYMLYFATLVMSIAFHYFEALNHSLTLQFLNKDKYLYGIEQLKSSISFF